MKFPYTYFEDEVREGFYISGNLKRAWAGQLEVLAEIDKVCKRHGIRWFIDCGTLLGAVRHGGYIPWDDDLDICMLYDDYVKFNKVAPYELPEKYVILNMHQDDDPLLDYLTRVTNSHKVTFDDDYLEKYHNCPYSIGIDVFPLYYLCPDEEEEELRREVCREVMLVAETKEATNNEMEKLEPQLRKVEELCKVAINREKPVKQQLYKLVEALFAMYHSDEANSVALMPYWIGYHNHKYPIELFRDTVMLPFENTYLPAPMRYDAVLKIEYGDYMKIYKGGGVHEYPFYKKQEKHVIEAISSYPFIYKFDSEHLNNERFPIKLSKRNVPVFLSLIQEAHEMIGKIVLTGQMDLCFQLLEQCQGNAIQMGEQIESDFYERHEAVKVLEEYCELLYELGQMAEMGELTVETAVVVTDSLKEIYDKIEESLNKDVVERKEIVFMPFRACYWDAIEYVWENALQEENADVYVMPIPYYERAINGELTHMHYEGNQFPEYVPIVNYEEFDIVNRHPDVIYMQNPYDECNFTMCVEPKFFSRFMKKYTEELVYIPYFKMDEIESKNSKAWITMEYFCTVPGLVHADRVILQSEQMREMYIERLTELAGEATRSIWESKIYGNGEEIYKVIEEKKQEYNRGIYERIPKEWNNRIIKEDGSYKKVLLFETGITVFAERGVEIIDVIKRKMEIIRSSEAEMTLIWRLPLDVQKAFVEHEEILRGIDDLKAWYMSNQIGIFDDKLSTDELVVLADAFYGQAGSMARAFSVQKKPILIMNADI